MLGGSSAINAMQYVRGNRKDYDRWAAYGNNGWDYDSVLPYFKRSEDAKDPDTMTSDYHGIGGPLPVSQMPEWPPLYEVISRKFHVTSSTIAMLRLSTITGWK